MNTTTSPRQYKSIVEVAQSRGSAAKTKAGAWKYLLSHLPAPIRGLSNIGTGRYMHGSHVPRRSVYSAEHGFNIPDPRPSRTIQAEIEWRKRVENHADAILISYGYDPNDPNIPGRVAARLRAEAAWENTKNGADDNILTAQAEHSSLRIGNAVYRHAHDEDRSYSTYSKGWHRTHGPAVTISNRRIERLEYEESAPVTSVYAPPRVAGDYCATPEHRSARDNYIPVGAYKIIRSVPVESYRGNYLIRAIAQDLGIAKIKYPKPLQRVQLNEYMEVRHIRIIGGVEIYQRTFAGEHVDYCIVTGDETFHADSIRDCIAGLRQKRATAPGTPGELLDINYALGLGFCRAGIEQFCEDYNLDCSATYRRDELQSLITAGNGRAEKYRSELIKAGFTV